MFDISEVGNPQYNVPFVLDLHKSPVTSVEYVNECPDNLTSSLYSVQSKQLVKQSTFKVCSYVSMYVCTLWVIIFEGLKFRVILKRL